MAPGSLPDVPDPTRVAASGADAVKSLGKGVVDVGQDIAAGVEQILFNTIEGGVSALRDGAYDVVQLVRKDINTGKTTVEKVRGDIDRACNSVLSQVDQTIGGEIVRKFKSEVERQLR